MFEVENQPLIGGQTPLPETFKVPDSLNAQELKEMVRIQNFFNFVDIHTERFTQILTKKEQEGVSLFPVNLEERVKKDAKEMARALFMGWKKTGLLDEYNRLSEKFYEGASQNAG